jgi:hypothetical protein
MTPKGEMRQKTVIIILITISVAIVLFGLRSVNTRAQQDTPKGQRPTRPGAAQASSSTGPCFAKESPACSAMRIDQLTESVARLEENLTRLEQNRGARGESRGGQLIEPLPPQEKGDANIAYLQRQIDDLRDRVTKLIERNNR